MNDLIIDKEFKNINFLDVIFEKAEYDNCLFLNCNFSTVNLSDVIFSDCTFVSCDFSMAKTTNTSFKTATFKECKLLGLHFNECNNFLLAFYFENCILNFSSFSRLKLKKTIFNNCSLNEVDFSETNLMNAIFNNCNLSGAIFNNSNLENVDFRTSSNFSIDPTNNQIKKAKFSLLGSIGLLNKYDIIIE